MALSTLGLARAQAKPFAAFSYPYSTSICFDMLVSPNPVVGKPRCLPRSDLLLLVGMRYWSAPPDEKHPYGHRRIETVITTVLGLALGAVGVGIGYQALVTLKVQHVSVPGWIAFAAAATSIVVKEILYRPP